ncbi:hypothetical protein DL239_13385 [Sedimentitalea sp. CY04]|uniref:Phage holin family protein n=1 Tax=Parasedimentitalea denitrificans TaxID=2211118 RepID=A0ABX0W9R1_9RHOB|nr:hypothetical protein [Sedimentitalea sp. CY04]NIZ61968.1 hypothetical protein [Sedimentitalea sp. CY04]
MKTNQSDSSQEDEVFQEALSAIQSSSPLTKIRKMIDNTNLSADMKALLYDIAKITIKVGETIIAVGRRVLDLSMMLVSKFPHTTLGVIVAVVLMTVTSSVLAWAPLLAVALNKLLLILGFTAGAVEDIRQNAMREAMERIALQWAPLHKAATL